MINSLPQNTTQKKDFVRHLERKSPVLADLIQNKRGYAKAIVNLILQFRHAPFIKLSNAYIAHKLQCSTRTVNRWTTWLAQHGYIIKSQQNQFSINSYTLCKQLIYDTKYEAYVNSLPENKIDLLMSEVPQAETVVLKSSLFKFKVYVYNPVPFSSRITHTHARLIDGDGYGKLTKRQREYRNGVGAKVQMVQKEVREWLLSQKDNKHLPTILRDPRIELISPVMKEVITILNLPEVDYLKMISFDEPVLKAAFALTKKTSYLKEPFAFFLKACAVQARQQGFTPEWNWYYEVCRLLNISTFSPEDSEPDERPSDMYKRSEPVHVKPKAVISGISAVEQKHMALKQLSGIDRLTYLHEEKRSASAKIEELDNARFGDFAYFTRIALKNKLDDITHEITKLEKEHAAL